MIKFVREDVCESFGKIEYLIFPWNETRKDYDYEGIISSFDFPTYEDAAAFAMSFLKDSDFIIYQLEATGYSFDADELGYIKSLNNLDIFEIVSYYDTLGNCIDCPLDKIKYMGSVYKYEETEAYA